MGAARDLCRHGSQEQNNRQQSRERGKRAGRGQLPPRPRPPRRSVRRFVEPQHPHDGNVLLLVRRVDHDSASRIVGVGRVDEDGSFRGERAGRHLPERDRDEHGRHERAAERQSRPPPPAPVVATGAGILALLGVLDSADDPRPEARPVGLGPVLAEAQAAMEESPDPPDILGLALTPGAPAQVSGDRPACCTSRAPRRDRRRSGGGSTDRSTRPLDVRSPHPYSHGGT